MNIVRKSATCQANTSDPNLDNTILTNLNIDNLCPKPRKPKKWLSLLKHPKPPNLYLDELDIEFSDTDSATSTKSVEPIPLPTKQTPIKIYKGNIMKRRNNDSPASSKKSKFDEDDQLFEDSFECFEDTQSLLQKSKPEIPKKSSNYSTREFKDISNVASTSKVQTALSHLEDIFVSQQIIDGENDPFKSYPKQSSNGKIDSGQDDMDSLWNHKSSKSSNEDEINSDEIKSRLGSINSEFDDFRCPKSIDSSRVKTIPVLNPDSRNLISRSKMEPVINLESRNDGIKTEPVLKNINNENFKSRGSTIDLTLNSRIKTESVDKTDLQLKFESSDYFVSSTTEISKPSTSKHAVSFTQFCDSSQILEQIEREIKQELSVNSSEEVKRSEPKIVGETREVKVSSSNENKQDFWDDTLNGALETFTTSQYKKELNGIFQKVENSIYDFGTNQDTTLLKNTTNNFSDETINNVLEKTFKTPEGIKRAIQKAEETLKATSSQAWSDDTILADAVINMSVEGKSIADIIKKALMENVKKNLTQQRLFNSTLVEEEGNGCEFRSFGTFYGLPDKVRDLMRLYKGIDKLYEWQDECLNLPSIKARKNLIYALPTSGGKTLVAEILLLREVLCRKKNVLFILPFVAIVQEKVWSLSPFAVALEFLIEEYAAGKGTYPPRKRRRKNSVYIATIEKGLGLMNSLIETGRADEIGLVVVDELHLIGDRTRGSTLEELLTKIIYIKKNIQIVGMSATIGNLPELSAFLQADVYTKNFRPVELVEYVKCGDELAKVDWKSECPDDVLTFERKLNYKYAESLIKIDPDRLGGLVMDVVPKDSCLVFCRSKKNCENVAILLCKAVFHELKNYKAKEKESIKNALKEEAGSLCNVLKTSITYGIAYHHSGLTSEERRIIEEGFRQGIICIICCTSTLAAGVNLPAKRVIIRNPYIGREFINLSRYKQMVGRAGRAGLGELGESILISAPEELAKVRELLMSPMDIATSSMHETNARGLAHFLLSCISLKIASTKTELQAVAATTLMGVQRERLGVDIKKLARNAIRSLFKMGALNVEGQKKEGSEVSSNDVTLKLDTTIPLSNSTDSESIQNLAQTKTVVNVTNDTRLEISKMGMAAIKGGLDLARAHILYEDLLQAQSSLVLFTGLHLMFLVTPYDLSEQVSPTNAHYYTLYSKLNIRELQTAKVLGITEAVATKMLSNKKITEVPVRILNRFYVTLMLYDLWNEMSVYDVATKYEINRGLIQNLMTSAASFASNVFHFCEEFEEFWAFSLLLKGMGDRLSHCCVRELIPLMNLPSVKQNRAKQLFQAGYKTLQSVAKADPNDLVESVEYMSKKLANQLIAAAKLILLERVENLREEAEDVLDGVEF